MSTIAYNDNVFINCPFDDEYKSLFNAIVFAIHDCSFIARSAQETEDGSQVRIDKIYTIIAECRYGIHDLSRTELDEKTCLPRFNMPLELGVFLGAKRYGEKDQQRKCTAIGNLDHYLNQDCATMAIYLKGAIRWQNGEDSPLNLRRKWL